MSLLVFFFVVAADALVAPTPGPHIPWDLGKSGRAVHRAPDVGVVEQVLTQRECQELIAEAESLGLHRSPVVYAGISKDVGDLVRLFGSGPAVWLGLVAVLVEHNALGVEARVDLAATAAAVWAASTALAATLATLNARHRERQLGKLRTSSSVALRGTSAAHIGVLRALCDMLPRADPRTFEALTVIRYECGQFLAPHFDANRAADAEDGHRGGQTLATLLIYLNDVPSGGETRFTRLGLDLAPSAGAACLFFPADANGVFDDRLEHEGRPLQADAASSPREKWIARVWVHADPVPPPYGLEPATLAALQAKKVPT